MKKILFFYALLSTFVSCNQFSAEYKRAVQENDSLKLHILKNEAEMNELLSILNAVEEDIQSIRINEDILLLQKDSELSDSRREQLKKNMSQINETLTKNRQRLDELQEKLNTSNINFSSLQKSIDRLSKEMNERGELVTSLRGELDKKNVHIEELSLQIEVLHSDVKILEGVNQQQTDRIIEQDQEIHTVYYCFGTKKELKEQNILTGGGVFAKSKALQGDFNHEYFIAADKRTLLSIDLFSSKATIKSNHPNGSYQFVKDRRGNLTLEIKHTDVFWSLSRFLVIEIR